MCLWICTLMSNWAWTELLMAIKWFTYSSVRTICTPAYSWSKQNTVMTRGIDMKCMLAKRHASYILLGFSIFLLSPYMWVKICRDMLICINTFFRLIHAWEVGSNKPLWINCTVQGSHFVFLVSTYFNFSCSHYFRVNWMWSKYFTHAGKYKVHQYHSTPCYHLSWINKKLWSLAFSQNCIKLSLGFDFHSFCSKRQLKKEEYV